MIPVVLAPRLPLFLVGRGRPLQHRLDRLLAGGADALRVFTDLPSEELLAQTGVNLTRHLPQEGELSTPGLLWITGLPEQRATGLARSYRDRGGFVNVEDRPAHCDFYNPAELRRGDLLVAISTGGRSPSLARRIKQAIAAWLEPEWAERLELIAAQRSLWRGRGAHLEELDDLTGALLERRGWLAPAGRRS